MQAVGEFDLIARYFTPPPVPGVLGVGDDCALLSVAPGHELAVSTDMLVEGRHFLPDTEPRSLGHKALAVNLSDLAAMGARPRGCTLALALPGIEPDWLSGFSRGFLQLAEAAGCPLVGGDTTRAEHGRVFSVTVLGEVRREAALRRDAARVGDDIWVSGTLGGAYLALFLLQGRLPADAARLRACRAQLEWPQARLALGQALAGVAHAAIDISDGLLQDLGHVLVASGCGAQLQLEQLPAHPALAGLDDQFVREALLSGGDAYELCFTAAASRRAAVQAIGERLDLPLHRIGTVVAGAPRAHVRAADGRLITVAHPGFDHFRPEPDETPASAGTVEGPPR